MELAGKYKKPYVTVCIYERGYDPKLKKTRQIGRSRSFTVHESTLQEVYEVLTSAIRDQSSEH